MKTPFYQLILITQKNDLPLGPYLKFIETCAVSGITAVQLREKNLSYAENLALGRELKKILHPHKIPLIVNDHLDLALALDAEGVHLGQNDGDPVQARNLLGHKKIIGVSIDHLENLTLANNLPLDYVGDGAIFPTQNKPNVTTHWSIHGLKQLATQSQHPIVAVGGINESNAAEVIEAGAQGIAAINLFHQTKDPLASITNLRKIMDKRNFHYAR